MREQNLIFCESKMLRDRLLCLLLIPMLASSLACLFNRGGDYEPLDLSGAYKGTLESSDAEGGVVYANERTHVVYVSPGREDALIFQLQDECSASASLDTDDGSFSIGRQTCVYESDGYSISGDVTGSGTLSEDGKLTLDYEIDGTIRRATLDMEVPYKSTNAFTGSRQ
ncbi:MAG: hypothetical protein VX475_10290 [Myxococcota bacterium]|nr:hypothetical protein [Myxococcota bacterium]